MRACDDEQGSSSPMRYECNEQGHGARAQGSSPALCRGLCAMGEWARARARHEQSRVGSKRAAPQRALPRASVRSLARSERKLACHECCAKHRSLARSERCCACDERCAQRWRASACCDVRRALRPAMACDCLLRRATSAAPSDGLRQHARASSAGARSSAMRDALPW